MGRGNFYGEGAKQSLEITDEQGEVLQATSDIGETTANFLKNNLERVGIVWTFS